MSHVLALADGKTKYAPAPGIPDLRAALAEKYRNENGIEGVEPSQVIVSPGGKFSCYLAILATISLTILSSGYCVSIKCVM